MNWLIQKLSPLSKQTILIILQNIINTIVKIIIQSTYNILTRRNNINELIENNIILIYKIFNEDNFL